ncbi:tRNA-dihydrouridine synthase [Candidatus Pelagibacter sp. Uisw_094]|uniref:tRNA-dihydrouridine synthase n=1 Tax=Candidatus Pelagibacter sp. Uisw_094 TaxID=3230980 RepID=UPI0039E868B8
MELVYKIKEDNPDQEIIINGGITTTDQMKDHLGIGDGVMIGRSVYHTPYSLAEIENEIFGIIKTYKRRNCEKLLEYLEEEIKIGTQLNQIMRHTLGLYHGQIGSKEWKRYLSENMMCKRF